MKNLYQTAKNYIAKPLIGLALVAGVSGCDGNNSASNQPNQTNPTPEVVAEMEKTYFTNWGFLDEIRLHYTVHSRSEENRIGRGALLDDLEIRLGDMDGDGDLDIVVGSRATGLRIYENRIPQQNK